MNINFKFQPNPLVDHDTSYVTRNANCFMVRHTPHPRRVCHIKGLNNIPICAVNDENFFKALCGGVSHVSHVTTQDKDKIPLSKSTHANNVIPCRYSGSTKMKTPPRPNSEPCKPTKEFLDNTYEGALKVKKEELRGRSHTPQPKANQGSMISELINPKSEVKGKTICIPNYLDQEIKILSKLCEILQTDSLAEVLTWLLHASVKEKEWVSALIHAELSEINLLKNRGHIPQNKPGNGKEKSSSTVKAPAKEEVPKVNRVKSETLEKSNEPRSEAETISVLIKQKNALQEAIEEYFSKTKPPAKNLRIWERNYGPNSKVAVARNYQANSLSPKDPKVQKV